MAAVQLLDGALTANTAGSWVAVPGSRAYAVQIVGDGLAVDLSIDGVNSMTLNQKFVLISPTGAQPRVYNLIDVPVAWMRANNITGSSITGKVYVQAQ